MTEGVRNKRNVVIIAEAGVNHNGDLKKAIELIDVASESGADIVKFQTFRAKNLASRNARLASYQNMTTGYKSQMSMLKDLELKYDWHNELMEHAIKRSIKFMSAPFDLDSIRLLAELGLDTFKIPSGEITNLPYLRAIGALRREVILSTGMSKLGEIEDALEVLFLEGVDKSKISLLHCTTEYPAPFDEVNLNVIGTLRKAFDLPVGYSDHTEGTSVSIAAVALGAAIIEKHFTLDRTLPGPDHKASLEPDELSDMVRSIREVERALGSGLKKPSPSEIKNISIARKSIVAIKPIKRGETFTAENIDVKRPGDGISPMRFDEILGREASRNFEQDDLIEI